MAASYVNLTVRGATADSIVSALRHLNRKAYVIEHFDGHILVVDSECEHQNINQIRNFAQILSDALKCVVFAVLVHDDDVMWYSLSNHGKCLDQYCSDISWFKSECREESSESIGGDADVLCDTFAVLGAVGNVDRILHNSTSHYGFASQRHRDLLNELKVPVVLLGAGYIDIDCRVRLPPEVTARKV